MKNKRNLGLIISYVYFVLNVVITILLSSFIIRTVGKTNNGVYQSMTAFLSYLILLEFGTGTLMARNLSLLKKDGSDKENIDKNISTIWSLTILLSFIIIGVSILFYFLIDNIYNNSMSYEQIELGKKIFIFAAINVVITFLTTTLDGVVLAYEHYLLSKLLAIVKILLRLLLVVIVLNLESNVLYVAIIDCSLSLFIFTIMFIYVIVNFKAKLRFKYFDKTVFKNCLPLALAMLIQTIVNTANGSVDKFCISVMLTPEDVSIYGVSMSMFSMFSSIATLPIIMFMPTVAKNYKAGLTKEELTETLIEPCRINVIITGLVMFGFIVVGKQFLMILYGADYAESWIYALIVIIPSFFNLFNGVIINLLDIMNKRHYRSYIMVISTLLNILLTVFGIMLFGIYAAPIATAISMVIQIVLLNIYYHRKIGINIPHLFYKSFKGIFIFLLISACVSYPISLLFNSIVVQFFVCGSVFVVLSFILISIFGLNEYEKSKFINIKNVILKKIFRR